MGRLTVRNASCAPFLLFLTVTFIVQSQFSSVPAFCGRVVSIPVLVKSPPGAQRSYKVKRRREKRARRGGRGKKEREAKAALFHHDLNGRALRVALVQATLETH